MEYLNNRDAKVLDVSSPEEENEDEQRDTLPEDLDVTGLVGPYIFPDNSRRRIPGYLYLLIAAAVVTLTLSLIHI